VFLSWLHEHISARRPFASVTEEGGGYTHVKETFSIGAQDLKNYRPVSNVTFVSKLVERVAVKQLVEYVEANKLMPRWQSAYRRHYSTETALLKVLSDVLTAADNQRVTLLALLDLSAAFYYIDHSILLSRFAVCLSISGSCSGLDPVFLD